MEIERRRGVQPAPVSLGARRLKTGPAASPATSVSKDADWSDPHLFAKQYRTELSQWGGFKQATRPRR